MGRLRVHMHGPPASAHVPNNRLMLVLTGQHCSSRTVMEVSLDVHGLHASLEVGLSFYRGVRRNR